MATGANVWRFLVYHIIDFVQELLQKQLLYFFWCILSLILYENDCESSDDFAGNCIREWDVWRPSFCLIFSLILRKWLRELALFLDHFTKGHGWMEWHKMDYLIFSAMRMRKCHLFCTSSHHNVPYGLSLEISALARARAQLLNMLYISTHLSVPHGENI